MSKRIGKCTNYASCELAFQNADIEPEGEFICPECGQPLQDVTPAATKQKLPKNVLLFGGIGLGALAIILLAVVIFAKSCKEPTPSPPVPPSTPTPAATPAPTISASPTIFPTATPLSSPTATPTTTPTPFPTATPIPTATVSLWEEELKTKEEVLERIDLIPNLPPDQKAALIRRVDTAKAMVKLITVPFGYAQKRLSGSAVRTLCESTETPRVKELMQDPTVVFVVLGFADTTGSTQSGIRLSTQRAETVVDSLRNECGVLSLMQAVGMGSTDLLDKDNKAKNRVVEVWAVLP